MYEDQFGEFVCGYSDFKGYQGLTVVGSVFLPFSPLQHFVK